MHNVLIVAIVFGGLVLALVIIGSTILMGLKILKGGVSRKGQKSQSDEARVVQEIYQGLLKMEKRVDALETILLEHERKDRKV